MIYDCFTFFNENDLLEIRLHELNDIVDKFIICEAPYTFSGIPKPLNFDLNRYSQFKDKIIYIVDNNMPNNGNAWHNEAHQRNCLGIALKELAKPNDWIMVGDLDEIPSKIVLSQILNKIDDSETYIFMQDTYYYYVNYYSLNYYATKICKYQKLLSRFNGSTEDFRNCWTGDDVKLITGGWHFGYLGGIEKTKYKIQSFSHQELNNPSAIDKTIENIKNMVDVIGRKMTKIPLTYATHPQYLVDHQEKFKHFIGE